MSRAELKLRCSIFASLRSSRPEEVRNISWDDLCTYYISGRWRRVAKSKDVEYSKKESLPLFGLYALEPGESRGNASIREVYALSLDFDEGAHLEDIESVFGDYLCGMHTTWSHAYNKPRCRLVLPLSRPVKIQEYGLLIRWAMEHAENNGLHPDPACKDPARMWFIPCTKNQEDFQYVYRESGEVEAFNVDSFLDGSKELIRPVVLEKDTVVRTVDGECGVMDWGHGARNGDKIKIACPEHEGSSVGSAFLRRTKTGVWMVCMSENHGHEKTPHKRFLPFVSEPAVPHDEGQPEESVLMKLDMKHTKKESKPQPTASNLEYILEYDSRLRGRIWLNDFRHEVFLDDKPWVDEDDTQLSIWLTRVYRAVWSTRTVRETVAHFSRRYKRNPLVEWLESVQWDGESRLGDWLVKGFGAADTEINRIVARKWAIQAISRAMAPGGQADGTLVLVGKQGAGKSTGLRALAGSWFSDTPLDFGKDSYLQISRTWIYEIAELDAFRGRAHSQIKAFLTAQVDTYRVPYKSRAEEVPRHVVFAATTNERSILSDSTGSRRFWPVMVDRVNREWISENSRQIWAEAVAAYRSGESWWMTQPEESLLFDVQTKYQVEDAWSEMVSDYIDDTPEKKYYTMAEIMGEKGLGLRADQMDTSKQKRVGEILRKLGYKKGRGRDSTGRRRVIWTEDSD